MVPAYAALGAVAGALVTAVASAALAYYQRRNERVSTERQRRFERHLEQYERIFVSARSAQDALTNYMNIERGTRPRQHDPFLEMLHEILRDAAYRFCTAVDWRHSPGMVYLNIRLERRCLHARDLLLAWLSRPRVMDGITAYVVEDDRETVIDPRSVRDLVAGSYRELRLESRTVLRAHPGDRRLARRIQRSLTSVINDLKDVMSY